MGPKEYTHLVLGAREKGPSLTGPGGGTWKVEGWAQPAIVAWCVGGSKHRLTPVFAIQTQTVMSHTLDVTSQALYLIYSAYDNTVSVRSQALYHRYSACDTPYVTIHAKTNHKLAKKMFLVRD